MPSAPTTRSHRDGAFALTAAGIAKFNTLAQGVDDQLVLHYQVTDGLVPVANTLTLTVHGNNDAPTVTAIVGQFQEHAAYSINLLTAANAHDVDAGAVLSITNADASVRPRWADVLARGTDYTVNPTTGAFTLTAAGIAKFDALTPGVNDQFVLHYQVTDGLAPVDNTLT